ncbi:MAG: glycoside hydrolase family 27 protein [Clostridiales bacterium]|jgi:hypothetical protein|nr:glycoside hydrolase family 27 protein [Clostridiales bacterium]
MTAKTPPMGWNSWDCYGASVNEETVRRNAEYMSENLKKYGYEYVVVDIQWSEPQAVNHEYRSLAKLEMDEYGRLLPAPNRFPSAANGKGFKELAEYVHSLGLKFGIHIMRGIPRQAAFLDTEILGTKITAKQIAKPNSICPWNSDMYGINHEADGAMQYYQSIFDMYAAWGVDFVKVDDIANHYAKGEIELIRKAIDNTGREIVLSISPGPAPIEHAQHLMQNVNMWRITDDFWDKWELLLDMFQRADNWSKYAGPGHWPDADMLPVGAILQDYNADNRTKFTKDEQKTMMTLWCFLRSPLMIGAELTKNDDFTLELLTNEDILELSKNSFCARQLYRRGDEIVWFAVRKTGGYFIAVFNTGEAKTKIKVNLLECELTGRYSCRNLWSKESFETSAYIEAQVNAHGTEAYVLIEKVEE